MLATVSLRTEFSPDTGMKAFSGRLRDMSAREYIVSPSFESALVISFSLVGAFVAFSHKTELSAP